MKTETQCLQEMIVDHAVASTLLFVLLIAGTWKPTCTYKALPVLHSPLDYVSAIIALKISAETHACVVLLFFHLYIRIFRFKRCICHTLDVYSHYSSIVNFYCKHKGRLSCHAMHDSSRNRGPHSNPVYARSSAKELKHCLYIRLLATREKMFKIFKFSTWFSF